MTEHEELRVSSLAGVIKVAFLGGFSEISENKARTIAMIILDITE